MPLSWNEITPRASTLADLYDPLTMPPELVKAHQARAVDLAYRPAAFPTDRARVELLFARYADLTTGPLKAGMAANPKRRKATAGSSPANAPTGVQT